MSDIIEKMEESEPIWQRAKPSHRKAGRKRYDSLVAQYLEQETEMTEPEIKLPDTCLKESEEVKVPEMVKRLETP